jgi:hypothetical protein
MNKTPIIDDDVIPLNLQEEIKNFLNNSYFPWYLCEEKTLTSSKATYDYFKTVSQNIFEYSQFVHLFVNDYTEVSSAAYVPMMLAEALKEKYKFLGNISRIKANLSTKVTANDLSLFNTPHIDDVNSHWVVIYYVNNSDGSTYLFDQTINLENNMFSIRKLSVDSKILPRQGRCVIFQGDQLHAGMHPFNTDYRMVINFNFSKQ